MKKLLIATTNRGKLKEFQHFLQDLPLELVSLADVGIDQDFEENGNSYAENSEGKARFYANLSGLPTLADDGGVEIDALGGMPGLHSKRWVGEDSTDEKIIEKMKQVAKDLPGENRKASFITMVTVVFPNGEKIQEEGRVDGIIAKEPLLELLHGYPYRSFFYLPQIQKYYHERDLSGEEEKLYNHRYKAIEKLKPQLMEKLGIS
ncbi:MAG: non-canonical purine NTP pyrophosphatase [Candidatus Levyibacteriota bacterium]